MYNEQLASRIRNVLGAMAEFSERKMFGGVAFLVGGNMAVAASSGGGLMVRSDPADAEHHLATPGVRPMVMRGNPLRGWLEVDAAAVQSDAALRDWIAVGTRLSQALRPKPPGRR